MFIRLAAAETKMFIEVAATERLIDWHKSDVLSMLFHDYFLLIVLLKN